MNNFINGNGKYSPLVIHLPNYSTRGHYVILAGKKSDNVYQVVDPANNYVWDITINGTTATYNGKTDHIDRIYQYYNSNAFIGPHTCDKGSYAYYEAVHPHYKCYKCSICGKIWRDTSAPTKLTNCEQCYPRTATVTYYDADGAVWTTASGTADTSYTLNASYPTKSGSYFVGWSYTAGTSSFDLRPNDTVTLKGSIDLYPVYVTHEEAVSGEEVYIYDINDFDSEGYNLSSEDHTVQTRVDNSSWTGWSDYSLTKATESATQQVHTTTMYRYYYFLCPSCGRHEPFTGKSDCGATISGGAWHEKWFDTPYSSSNYQSFSYTTSKYYTTSLGDGQMWIFSAGNLNDTAVGTTDATGSASVIETGYSTRQWVSKFDTVDRTATAYRIKKAGIASGTCGEDLTWVLENDGTLTISGTGEMEEYDYYSSNSPWKDQKESIKRVVIGNGVTGIGDHAFSGCTSLTSVTLPNSVTSIKWGAFSGCTSLTSVTIPDSVTKIGWCAFSGCTGLTSVTISNSVTSIEESTFSGCTGLTTVYIPAGVTSIGNYAFSGCTSLTSVTIPDSVTSIGYGAFKGCTGLTSVMIPDSVTGIYSSAFENCTSLTKVRIPAGATVVSSDAFDGCTAITEFTVAEENASYTAEEGVLFDKDMTKIILYPKGKSGSYTIPSSVICILPELFSGCAGLTNIVIPNSVTEINMRAFSDCTSLTAVTIPDSVTEIGRAAFEGCTSLISVEIPSSVSGIQVATFRNCTSLGSVTIPDSVTSIGPGAFDGCTSLDSVTISDSVTGIGYEAFYNCSKLKNVKLPSKISEIDDNVFSGCETLEKVEIPDGVTAIKRGAFDGCTSLTSVTIPDSVTHIGYYAFSDCSKLKNVKLPSKISEIDHNVFSGCETLEKVEIPDGVTAIKREAFDGCTSLTSVTIPASVTAIGYNAFSNCGKLKDVYYKGTDTQWSAIEISDGNNDLLSATLHFTCEQHSFTNYIPNGDATCTTDGTKTAKCDKCGQTDTVIDVGSALGHDIVTDEAVSATCTGAGLTEGSHCSRCGTVLKAQAEIPALGHDYKNGTCTRCGDEDPNYKPAAPAAPAVKPDYLLSTGKPYLKWKAVDGAVKYYVYRSGSKSGTYKYIGTATKLNYTDTTAKPGYYYYYKVKAVNASGVKSSYSTAVTALCRCARPKLNDAQYQASTGKPYLSWGAVTGAGKYYVYRAGSQNGAYKYIGSTTKTNYTDATASAGYTYYYKVEAVSKVRSAANSANSTALAVNSHCARPTVKPDYLASTGKPYLKWSAVTGASKYHVYRAGSQNGTYKYIGSTTKTNYTDTTASAGYAYYYKVKAVSKVKAAANSAYSTVVKATCHCAKPVVKIALTQKGDPKLTWNTVAGASKYEVYRATSKNGTYTKMFTTTNRSYTNTNARPGTTYYYKVKAISRVRSTANSSYSVVKSIRAR